MSSEERRVIDERHRRIIELRMRSFEEALIEIQRLVSTKDEQGIFYRMHNPLSASARRELLEKIEQIKQVLLALKEEFGFSNYNEDIVSRVRGILSYEWTVLCDTESKRLRGYGDPAPELTQVLDPYVARLIALVEEMNICLNERNGSLTSNTEEIEGPS